MTSRGSPLFWSSTLILAAMLVLPAGAIEVPLAYQTPKLRDFFPHGGTGCQLELTAPARVRTLPEFVSSKPVYTTMTLGDQVHTIMLDKHKASDKFYTRMYFDANANGDLTDDQVYLGTAHNDQHQYQTEFSPVKTTIVVDGTELPYEFQPSVYCYLSDPNKDLTDEANWRNCHMFSRSQCAYTANVEIGRETYTVWLADQNGNGTFNDRFSIPEGRSDDRIYGQGDGFYLVREGEKLGHEHVQVLGQHLVVSGKVFDVRVNTPAGTLTLDPVTEGLAKLVWPDQLVALEVYEPETNRAVMLFYEGKQAPIPDGKYRLLSYRLIKKDDQGDQWQLAAMGTGKSPIVTAKADHVTRFALGEPFQPIVTVPQWARQQSEGRLDLQIRGRSDEVVTDLRHVSGTRTKIKLSSQDHQRPAEPTYKIIRGDGEMVGSGRFEYG